MQNSKLRIQNSKLIEINSRFLLAARHSVQAPSALAPQRRLKLLEDGKTAAYLAYVRILRARETTKEPYETGSLFVFNLARF